MNKKILVMGIGNTLLSDEGIGVHVLHEFIKASPDATHIRTIDAGTLSFTLAADVAWAEQIIVIDAAQLKQPAGYIKCFENESMDWFLGHGKCSVHEVGLLDLMDIARLTDSLPQRRALVGIQPSKIDWGEMPSVEVAAAIPQAVACIHDVIERWQ